MNNYAMKAVKLKNEVLVKWSYGRRKFDIEVPDTFKNKVCGLCGNYNGKVDDDWIMGSGWKKCPVPDLTGQTVSSLKVQQLVDLSKWYILFVYFQTPNGHKFGGSWLAELDRDDGCNQNCDNMDDLGPTCQPDVKSDAEKHCSVLLDTTGMFKVHHE